MAVFTRAKRVSDPLDDKVKARLRGDDCRCLTSYGGGGAACCLSGLINDFFEFDETFSSNSPVTDGDDGHSADTVLQTVRDLLEPSGKGDPFRLRLHSDAIAAAEALSGLRSSKSAYRRAVTARLRESGYNAGICSAKWESCGGLTAGSYEYIDVVEKGRERHVVDLEFSAQFEVARPTAEYESLVAVLPRVMVGTAEEVAEVVRMAAEAAQRSLKRRELHVPPWRKSRYMLAKWLGPYRRTVSATAVAGGGEIKCRAVGFGADVGRFVSPAARTR